MVGSNRTPNRMITAVRTERAWLQQCHGCLPVLLVHHCKGSDIYIRGKSEPLTEQLRIHLQYTAPPEPDTLETPRRSKEDWHRERTMWSCGTQAEIAALLAAGYQPPEDEPRILAKVERAKAVMDARHQRQVDREAQKQESNNRKQQRAAKPQRKGTRPPIVNNNKTKVRTTMPTTDEGWLDAQIESMIKSIQAKARRQARSKVAA